MRRYRVRVTLLPDPIWPVVVLAAICLLDAIICIKPVAFIARCWDDVHWPRRYWRFMAPIKFAAAAGLVIGIWLPVLGIVTAVALVVYFIVAVAMHIRARDLRRNFVSASGMLLICVAVLVVCFLV